MPKDTTITRQWKLLASLAARKLGVTVKDMAADHGVTLKTIRRDLLFLQRQGFPIAEKISEHGRKHWRLTETASRPPLGFTYTEALGLYLGRKFLEPLAGTQFWTEANSALSKIRACLGETPLRYIDKMAGVFHHSLAGASNYSQKAQVLDDLTVAIEDCCVTWLVYQSDRSTEPVTREIHPYGLIYHRNSLYLVAWATEHQEVRTYKLDRVESADVTKLLFPKPADFKIAEHVAGSFGIYRGPSGAEIAVKVRFAAPVARYVREKDWHASQELEAQPDGSVIARFRLSTTEEIKHWLLSFGRHVEVLEPARLIADLRAEIAALLEIYQPVEKRGLAPSSNQNSAEIELLRGACPPFSTGGYALDQAPPKKPRPPTRRKRPK